jgi:hypothetical protein
MEVEKETLTATLSDFQASRLDDRSVPLSGAEKSAEPRLVAEESVEHSWEAQESVEPQLVAKAWVEP